MPISIIIICSVLTSIVLLFFPGPVLAADNDITLTDTDDPFDDEPVEFIPALEISHSSRSAIVIETGRMRRLYEKNSDQRLNIPAANKLMTALLAAERLTMDTQVTISRVAAEADTNQPAGDGIVLENGDKYPLEYLLLRMLFYDSDAAALAIAEQISNVEDQFVEMMNSRAAALDMNQTVYRNASGYPVFDPDYLDSTLPGSDGPEYETEALLQYSTVEDVARLMTVAMQNQDFARLIRKESEYLVLEGQRLVAMQNQISTVWTLSERRIQGAFFSQRLNRTSMAATGRFNDINFIVITAGGFSGEQINDLLAIVEACSGYYITDTLVEIGQRFTGDQEQTLDGEPFGLLFRKTVYYVRPADDLFLKPTIRYVSFGPHSRPIQRSMTVGQVIFELKDGTTIAVDVGPDRQILSDITVIDHALNELQNNPNLSLLILIVSALLILTMSWQVVRYLIQIVRLTRLIWLERKFYR